MGLRPAAGPAGGAFTLGPPGVVVRGPGGGVTTRPNGPGGGGGSARLPCLPRGARVSANRIGPARLGRSLKRLERRYRVVRRRHRAVRFCVRGGGRFLVSARRGKI